MEPLDLSQADMPIWHVLIQDTAYGPYTLAQLQHFIGEGRIGPQTKIAKGDGGAFADAEKIPALTRALKEKFGIADTAPASASEPDTPAHNYIVIVRLKSENRALIQLLNNFGKFGEAMPGIYVLRSRTRLSVIQKALSAALSARDQVLIVDATADRLGWFNLGPEADIHLRSVWDKKAE